MLALQVLLLGIFGIACSYFGDYLHSSGFFGDMAQTPQQIEDTMHSPCIDDGLRWGTRHIYYFWTCTTLICCTGARIIHWAVDYWEI